MDYSSRLGLGRSQSNLDWGHQVCDPSLRLKLKFVISFAWASLWGDWPVRVIRCRWVYKWSSTDLIYGRRSVDRRSRMANDLALEPPVSLLCDVTFLLLLYSYCVIDVTWNLRFCPCLLTKLLAYPIPFVFLSRGRRGYVWAHTLV